MPKDKLPYFKWFPKDFDHNEKVRLMNLEEIGLYALCLNHSWVNGSLPADVEEIGRAMKVPPKQLHRAWQRVAPCFVEAEPGRLVNPRQELERAKAITKSGKCTDAVLTRYGRKQDVTPRAYVSVSESGSPEGSAKGTNLWSAAGFSGPEDFEQWWTAIVNGHPSKNRHVAARLLLFDWIVTGQFAREKFDSGYPKLLEANRKDWTKEGGKYCTNLLEIIENRLYQFTPSDSANAELDRYETPEQREERITREDADRRGK